MSRCQLNINQPPLGITAIAVGIVEDAAHFPLLRRNIPCAERVTTDVVGPANFADDGDALAGSSHLAKLTYPIGTASHGE